MRFFFFQAEDGIRDGHVTGVQTCALPICRSSRSAGPAGRGPGAARGSWRTRHGARWSVQRWLQRWEQKGRSEERRVGKSVERGGGRMSGRRDENKSDKDE